MTTNTTKTLLARDKVFGIQELLEAIMLYLDFEDPACPRLLACVCRRWYSYFEPYIWKRFTLVPRDKQSTIDFQQHGSLVRDLTCDRVDKSVLKAVALYGASLDTVRLVLDHSSSSITHVNLEETFLRIQTRLTTVSIKLDASVHNVATLRTLSRLTHLTHLSLQVDGTVDVAELYLQIRGSCPTLRSLDLDHWTPSAPRALFNRLKTSVKRTLTSRGSQQAPPGQETFGPEKSTSSKQESSLTTRQSLRLPSPLPEFSKSTIIRRLELCGLPKDIPISVEVIKSCSLLEDLHLRDESTALDPRAWMELSVQCPHLRTLRLTGQESKLLIGNNLLLITLFPRLRALYLHLRKIQWTDWTRANIDHSMAGHEERHRTRHPLKTLSITGNNTSSLPTFLNILSTRSLEIETLVVGSLSEFQNYFENSSFRGPTDVSRSLGAETWLVLLPPWLSLKDTLTQLDLHTTIIPSEQITTTLFRRLQELHHLRALCVSTKHISDWTPTTFRMPPFWNGPLLWKGPLPIARTFVKNSIDYKDDTVLNEYTNMLFPRVEFSFPSIQVFVIKSSGFGMHRMVTTTQAIFVLATTPALEHFVLGEGSIDEGTLKGLRDRFPKKFKPLSEKYLSWIEAVDGL
ncbi:MAG: hypothetical protein J3R72DRAFT_195875 [Linnemannia gamsii]|nr:MAG: hypothetical protein J3R72DRAFT_195875 [Linnemannia gamsii]